MFENTRAFSGFAVDDIEAAKKFFFAEAGVHQKSGPLGLKQGAIA